MGSRHLPLHFEVYFHGESLVAGDLDTHDWLCSALAQLSRALVLSVAYRQPPEVSPLATVPFPCVFEHFHSIFMLIRA